MPRFGAAERAHGRYFRRERGRAAQLLTRRTHRVFTESSHTFDSTALATGYSISRISAFSITYFVYDAGASTLGVATGIAAVMALGAVSIVAIPIEV